MPERSALHAYLSEEAHDKWHDTAAELGVSVSALLQVIAEELIDREKQGTALSQPFYFDEELAKRGRKLDAERRRR